MDYEKKLSVCMIIKNEEKNLHRCLQSIKPVIDSGFGELIIVDTGSEDSSIEIAREYTDRVYQHAWNDNFSDMRNISISYGKGEWIWILDADEEIKNPEEMISLFKQDLSKYNTITARAKNYLKQSKDGEEVDFAISVTNRGFRNTGDFGFDGAIHNQARAKGPYYSSEVFFDHYGYTWDDEELRRSKFERTAGILKKELEKDPNNIYYQFQLSVSWINMDLSKALVEMRKTYKLMEKLAKDKRARYLYIYGLYGRVTYANEEYEETIKVCEEGLSYNEEYIDLLFLAGSSYWQLNDTDNALKYFQKYLEVEKYFLNTQISKDPSCTFYHLDEDSKEISAYYAGLIKHGQKKYDEALNYAQDMRPSERKAQLLVKISVEVGEYSGLIKYMDEIYTDEKQRNILIKTIEELNLEGNNTGMYEDLVDFYENLQIKDEYYILNKVRVNIGKRIFQDQALLDEIFKLDYENLVNYYGDIIYYLISGGLEPKEFNEIILTERMKHLAAYAMVKYNDFYELAEEYLYKYKDREDLDCIRVWLLFARYILGGESLDDERYLDVLYGYIDRGSMYLNVIYNPIVLEKEMIHDLKNGEQVFLLYLSKAMEIKDTDTKEYIGYLNKALKAYPVKRGIELLLKEVEEGDPTEDKEMKLLKKQFKDNIKLLIEKDMFIQAESLIKEYEQMVEDDMDILLFKSQITVSRMKNKNEPDYVN